MNGYDYDADRDAEMREIMEEMNEYSENAHRSEEDGWFYSDNDGEESACE